MPCILCMGLCSRNSWRFVAIFSLFVLPEPLFARDVELSQGKTTFLIYDHKRKSYDREEIFSVFLSNLFTVAPWSELSWSLLYINRLYSQTVVNVALTPLASFVSEERRPSKHRPQNCFFCISVG